MKKLCCTFVILFVSTQVFTQELRKKVAEAPKAEFSAKKTEVSRVAKDVKFEEKPKAEVKVIPRAKFEVKKVLAPRAPKLLIKSSYQSKELEKSSSELEAKKKIVLSERKVAAPKYKLEKRKVAYKEKKLEKKVKIKVRPEVIEPEVADPKIDVFPQTRGIASIEDVDSKISYVKIIDPLKPKKTYGSPALCLNDCGDKGSKTAAFANNKDISEYNKLVGSKSKINKVSHLDEIENEIVYSHLYNLVYAKSINEGADSLAFLLNNFKARSSSGSDLSEGKKALLLKTAGLMHDLDEKKALEFMKTYSQLINKFDQKDLQSPDPTLLAYRYLLKEIGII